MKKFWIKQHFCCIHWPHTFYKSSYEKTDLFSRRQDENLHLVGENVYSLGEGSTGLLYGHLHEPLLWLINGPEGLDMKAAKYNWVNNRLYKGKTFLCWEFWCFNTDEGRERAIWDHTAHSRLKLSPVWNFTHTLWLMLFLSTVY